MHAFLAGLPSRWLTSRGGLPAGVAPEVLASADGVPVDVQRALLLAVCQRGGEPALLSLGRALREVQDQPLLFVMLNARTIDEVIDKEQRLNRFFHSDHRVRVLERGDAVLTLAHHGPRAKPARAESLFVLGLHLALLSMVGCDGLRVRLPESDAPRAWLTLTGDEAPPAGRADVWRFEWTRFVPRREPLVGLDALLLRQAEPRDLAADDTVAGRLGRLVAQDLSHRWTVSEAAGLMHTSSRSMQRGLAAEATSFSRVLEAARVDAAGHMLRDPARSVTEIGYVCGFSDGAHFSRRFKAHTGYSPLAWRKQHT